MKITHCNKRSVTIETLWMKKLRLREIRKRIQVPQISKLQHKDSNQDFRSIKACVLSPEMCSFSHTPSNLWLTNSDESPFYVSSVWENKWGRSTKVWDREVDGQSTQSNRCSDRSRPRELGNRHMTVWRISKKAPWEGDAWNGFKGPMRIIQINNGMRSLKHLLSDFSFL